MRRYPPFPRVPRVVRPYESMGVPSGTPVDITGTVAVTAAAATVALTGTETFTGTIAVTAGAAYVRLLESGYVSHGGPGRGLLMGFW